MCPRTVDSKTSQLPDHETAATFRDLRLLVATPCGAYLVTVVTRDTEPKAHEAQVAAVRKLGPEGRAALAAQMSEDIRRISIEGVRQRHPEYTQEQARRAVLRRVWGEPLASRVWRDLPEP
jgi:hypothetical protein